MPPPHQPIISLQIPETMTKSPGLSRDRPFPSGTRLASRYRCNVFIFHGYGLPPLRSQIKTIIQNNVVVFVFVFVVVIRCYELCRCSGRGGYHRCVPWPSPCSLRLLELLFVETFLNCFSSKLCSPPLHISNITPFTPVAIRMRPLNLREQTTQNNRVWRVQQKYNSIT